MISLSIKDKHLELTTVVVSDLIWFRPFLANMLRTGQLKYSPEELKRLVRNRDDATMEQVLHRLGGTVYLVLDDQYEILSRLFIFAGIYYCEETKLYEFTLSKDMIDRF